MEDFGLYYSVGLHHILTWDALDHILFLAALCLRYQWSDWKKILVLVTAFTIGHCTTLVLGVYDMVFMRPMITEFFIALTILFTALSNLVAQRRTSQSTGFLMYALALVFGMVHGLGFAYGIKSILGHNENITVPLLAFNSGIEAAQLIIVTVILCISFIMVRILQLKSDNWILFVSGVIVGLAFQMALERNPFKEHENEITFSFYNSRSITHVCRTVAVL